jgi:hypothetical protein
MRDIADIRSRISYVSGRITDMKIKLERAKINNERYDKLKERRDQLSLLCIGYDKLIEEHRLIDRMILEEETRFRQNRVDYLNDMITDRLALFFPNDNRTAHLLFENKRGIMRASLLLEDGMGNQEDTNVSASDFQKYLIGFTATCGILEAQDKHIIFVDEAFGVADKDNVVKMGECLDKSVKSGTQIILISQNADLYSSVERREFVLSRDPITNVASIVSVTDY